MERLSEAELTNLRDKALVRLKSLVTPDGIYASEAIGWDGPYHAWFGRDSAITADFIFASLEYGGDRELALTAVSALKRFAEWQGKAKVADRGEEKGKLPHEVRTEFNSVDAVQHAARTNELPWYVDPETDTLKNWDTADGTSLWALTLLRSSFALGKTLEDDMREPLRQALAWIVRNIEEYDGLVGFTGASLQPGRVYSGLHNQGWKDTESVYQTVDGNDAPHPIKDVLVNAEAWAALREGADFFADIDPDFSSKLTQVAHDLRSRFNDERRGFMSSGDESVLAQAIDGAGTKLEQSAVDQGAVLWARTENGELCIDDGTVQKIVERMLSRDMFNPEAGIRDYALGTEFDHGTNYHGSPYTYWPFMSGMVARGMEQAGYTQESEVVMQAFLNAIHTLGTNIEMFVQNQYDEFEPWSHPDPEIGQMSSREQAWTAAAVYYASLYLLHKPENTASAEE